MGETETLSVENLRYTYPSSREGAFVLSIADFHAVRGSVTLISGENGSGKTTFLRILAGLARPESGVIRMPQGRSKESVLVHQNPYLLSGSVAKNVGYGLRIKGLPANLRREITARSLEAVGLSGYEYRRPDRLSGGERQRVAIARALAVSPMVLLLDEPTANVDKRNLARIEGIIRGIADAGTIVVITSHDAAFTYRMADELVSIENGSLKASEVNLLKGEISGSDGSFAYFRTGSGQIRCVLQEGSFRTAVVPYNDVILSIVAVETSAQNQLKGIVTDVSPENGRYRVRVDCGFYIAAVVTGFSVESLGIKPGAELYVIFKASSVRLY